MIHWLTQILDEIPAEDYLTDVEIARFQELKTEKRRADWLLGRWTAKRLLQTVLWEKDGVTLPLDMITITNNPDGDPDYRLPITDHRFSISISHAHGRAFVAAVEKDHAPIGADMELIQPRPAGFAEEYFTLAEIALGYGLVGSERAVWETAVWSAKEAVLKALHLGLSVDTRAISCLIEPVERPPTWWTPFAIRFDQTRLPKPAPPLTGWWRVEDDFVLAIATG
ncbi:MAG: 4'-phosphopantetheinyl transferase superfamily protein [Anaerolineae bacterium]|nr:4'-phosphopantetheinyl transferase superfamily protein [Anaerolineae bacterium]